MSNRKLTKTMRNDVVQGIVKTLHFPTLEKLQKQRAEIAMEVGELLYGGEVPKLLDKLETLTGESWYRVLTNPSFELGIPREQLPTAVNAIWGDATSFVGEYPASYGIAWFPRRIGVTSSVKLPSPIKMPATASALCVHRLPAAKAKTVIKRLLLIHKQLKKLQRATIQSWKDADAVVSACRTENDLLKVLPKAHRYLPEPPVKQHLPIPIVVAASLNDALP